MRALPLIVLLMLPASCVHAEIVRGPVTWGKTASFTSEKKANTALSGVACVPDFQLCLAVNDEARFAQFFRIDDHTIIPDRVIALIPKSADGKELDAEGAAYAAPDRPGEAGYFYVTGSHGLPHDEDKPERSRYVVVRFPVDPRTGQPTFSFEPDKPSQQVQPSKRLTAAIATLPLLAPFVDRRLQEQGVNVEGLAVVGRDLLFGLRSPCIDRQAFVIRVPIDALFAQAPLSATLAPLTLGDNTGIRDLAQVSDGVLILSGRSDDDRSLAEIPCGDGNARPAPAVWFWNGTPGAEAQPLGALPGLSGKGAAETLQVLSEDATSYRVLVWFDNIPDGEPTEFIIAKPR